MSRSARLVLAFVACWLGAWPALRAQDNDATERGRPFLEVFRPVDYRGHQQVFDIAQSSAGLIYLSNFGALLEFDGARWRTIPVPTQFIRHLAPDESGRIWLGGSDELGWCESGPDGATAYHSLTAKVPAACRPLGPIGTVQWHDGAAWFSTDRHVLRWRDGQFQHWEFSGAGSLRLRHGGKNLWLSARDLGLRRWSDGEWKTFSSDPALAGRWANVVVDDWTAGTTLLGLDDGRLVILGADGGTTPFAAEFSAMKAGLNGGVRLRSGSLVITTRDRGVALIDPRGNLLQWLTAEEGLPSSGAYAAREDREGGVWIGTSMGAARAELGSPFTFFQRDAGVTPSVALAIARNRDGLFVGSEEGTRRLVPAAGAKARFAPVPGGAARVFTMLRSGEDILVGTIQGVARISGGNQRLEIPSPRPVLGLGRSLSAPERIFVAVQNKISTYRESAPGQWIEEGPIADFVGEARTLIETEPGELWVGTVQDGFARITRHAGRGWQSAAVDYFRKDHGLPPKPGWVRVLPAPGGVWFSTAQGALAFERAKKEFVPAPPFAAAGLAGRYTFPIVGTRDDEIWAQIAASEEPEDLERPEIGRLARAASGGWNWQPLPARVVKQVGYYGAYEMQADPGVLWLTGQNAIVRVETERLGHAAPTAPAALMWRQVARADVGSLPLHGPAPELPASPRPLRFAFARPVFSAASDPEFSHRLRGSGDTWSEWRKQAEVELTGLATGSYVMEIRARDLPDKPEHQLAFPFRILPPWYAAPGMIALYALTGIVAVGGVFRWRLGALRRDSERLEKLVAERTRELDAATQRAEAASRAKSLFLANASHELRSPLHAILGYVQLLEADRALSRSALDRLRIVGASSRQLLRLINEILDLSKIEAGRNELRSEPFDLGTLIAEVAEAQETRARAKGLSLRMPDRARLPGIVRGDATKLRQVLENLLGNAVKFTARGEVTLAVMPLDAERLRFEITDTGPGIPAEDIPRLFQPFEQAGNQLLATDSGTGLGLAIVQRLAALMGTSVHLASEVGRGSRFTFDLALPRVELRAGPDDPEVAPVLSAPRGPGGRVLVVDDIAINRELLRELLEPVGYTVEMAGSAEEARALLARTPVDLLILDLRLPGMGGLELARLLRAESATARLPILAASASALDQDPAAALAAGCDGFIAKPFLTADLLRRVAELLDPAGKLRARAPLDPSAWQAVRAAALVGDVVQLRREIGRLRAAGAAGPLLDEIERRAQALDVDGIAALTAADHAAPTEGAR